MEGSLFVYTRLSNYDYRLLFAPSLVNLPNPVRTSFVNFAREVINVDNICNGDIVSPRWSLIKSEGIVLIGIGCYNNYLRPDDDGYVGPRVRGFFGIVIKDQEITKCLTTLLNEDYYKTLFNEYVFPLWEERRDSNKINSNIAMVDVETTDIVIEDINNIDLNTLTKKCKVSPDSFSVRELFISALRYDKVNIVCNLNNFGHIRTANLFHFSNATIIGNSENYEFEFEQEQDSDRIKDKPSDSEEGETSVTGPKGNDNDDIVVVAVKKLLRKGGIVLDDFVRTLAKKCGLEVIPERKITEEDDSSCHPGLRKVNSSDFTKKTINLEKTIKEQESVAELVRNYEKDKLERLIRIQNIQSNYKKKISNTDDELETVNTENVNDEKSDSLPMNIPESTVGLDEINVDKDH